MKRNGEKRFVEQRTNKGRVRYCRISKEGKRLRFLTASGHSFAVDTMSMVNAMRSLCGKVVV